nr:hypothetical protein [Treponema endosymbiont of Eucomonympha sp.]
MERFQAQYGWAVKHPEAIKRLCNIKASDLTATLAENLVKEILTSFDECPRARQTMWCTEMRRCWRL